MCWIQENINLSICNSGHFNGGQGKNMRRVNFHFSDKKQLARIRMNKYVPRIIRVDLSDTARNQTYENIIAYEVIKKDVFEHKPLHINLNHILSPDAIRMIKKMNIMTKTSMKKNHNMNMKNNHVSRR